MITTFLLFNRFGKLRLHHFYEPAVAFDPQKPIDLILKRQVNMCNIVEWKTHKIVYKK